MIKEILSAPSLTHGEPGPFNFVRKNMHTCCFSFVKSIAVRDTMPTTDINQILKTLRRG